LLLPAFDASYFTIAGQMQTPPAVNAPANVTTPPSQHGRTMTFAKIDTHSMNIKMLLPI